MMALAALLPQMAQAKVEADYFNNAYMIRDLRWDKALGCIEFKILVQDTYKDNTNEYIGGADIVISGQKIGRLTAGNVNGDDGTGIMSDTYGSFCFTPYDPLIDPSVFKNKIKDRLTIIARFRGDYKTDLYSSSTTWHDYTVVQPGYHSYGTAIGLVDESGDPEVKDRLMYAVFRYYPGGPFGGDLSNFGGISVSVENDVWIEEEAIKGSHAHLNINGSFFKQIKISNILSPVTLSEVYYFNNYRNTDNTVSVPGLTFKVNRTNYDFADDMDENLVFLEFFALNDASCTKVLRTTRAVPLPKKTSSFTLKTDTSWRFTTDEIKQGRLVRICYTNKLNESDYPAYRARFVRYSSAVTIKPFPPPTGVEVTDNGCGILKISWDVNTSSSEYASSYIHIYNGNSIIHSSDYSVGKWEYNIKEYINTDTKAFDIKLTHAPFDYTSPEALKTTVTFNKNMRYRTPSSLNTTASSGNGFRLKWNNGDGYYCNDYKYRITVTQIDSLTQQEIVYTSGLIGMDETEANITISSDIEFNLCKPTSIGMIMIDPANSDIVLSRTTEPLQHTFVNESEKSVIEEFTASKGFYPDRVELNWKVSTTNKFANYIIYRKEYGRNNVEGNGTQVAVINNSGGITSYTYEDEKAVPGTYYTYTLIGQMTCGDGILSTIGTATNTGFIQPFGTVSGRITFENGTQAVTGVSVAAEGSGEAKNKALVFNGKDTTIIVTPCKAEMFDSTAFTFQAWTNVTDTATSLQRLDPFMDAGGKYAVEVDRKKIYLAVYKSSVCCSEDYYFDDFVYQYNRYCHISITYSHTGGENGAGTAILYIDGTPVDTVTKSHRSYAFSTTSSADSVVYFGRRCWESGPTFFRYMHGYMDEVRLWKRALTAEEIEQNYDRYLTGRENGLALYYRFDEPSGMDEVFDISAVSPTGSEFNRNHGKIYGDIARTSYEVPDELLIKTFTDENGNYLLNTIPYTGIGNTYNIIPSFGVHQFSPKQKPLFFSNNSTTHNNIDFADISSFKVSGQILYSGSNYPVEEVQISIDGSVASRDGKIIQTDAEGKFTVNVPIGEHFISVAKQGHVFANGGRFPANELEKYNFQTEISGLLFDDQTTVRIKGRVAGGQPQTDKRLGFGLSKANIGKATVTLKTNSDEYRLNLTGADSIVDNNEIGGVTSKTIFKAAGNLIDIETNPVTGEFLAVLPPVPYTVAKIKTKEFEDTFIDGDPRDFEVSKMTFTINPVIADTSKYTDPITGTKTVVVSHDSLKITKYNDPTLLVADKNNEYGAFGDSIYVYTNPTTGDKDTVRLYTVSGGTVTYTLGVPVLSQKTYKYHWNIKAYEEYINKDTTDWISDIVPLEGSQISISNALAAERIIVDSITYNELSREESSSLIVLDTAGSRDYSFAVSFPNLAGDHKLNAKFTLSSNSKYYTWEQSAILFGQMPSDGNNFVTKGPDHVDIVLHDPPGSNSYAYIEKGSSYTQKVSYTDVTTVSEAVKTTIHIGPEVKNASGSSFFMVISEIKSVVDIEIDAEFEQVFTDNNEQETTITFGQQISTSGDPNYIGSMADVYIGRSTNLIFGMMNQLALYPNTQIPEGVTPSNTVGTFSLFPQRLLTADQEFGTAFTYTQTHILETQIPNIKELRNQLLETVSNPSDTTGLFFGDKKVKYLTSLPASHPQFGEPETYYVHYAPDAIIEKEQNKDEVWEYNTWILNWQKRISENEETQIKLFEKRAEYEENKAANASDIWNNKKIFENVSYDAGVSLEKSTEVSYSDFKINGFNWTAGGSIGGTMGFGFNKVGFEVNVVAGAKREQGSETASGSGNSMKFGYVLAEDESVLFAGLDALSVDVYGPMWEDMKKGFNLYNVLTLSGYTFQRRAGQTSCPHEQADSTLFYKKDGKSVLKNYGTFKIEKAQLYVDNKTSASVENIPAGREGTFTLQLQNLSEAKMDVTYRLVVDPVSNPNGLILELDGQPLTDVRQFRIKYGEETTKVLKVRQSSIDILEYDNIAIRFGSVCDVFDYSEAFISASFIPSSSPVKLVSNSRLANLEGLNNGGTIKFTVSDYDRAYKNFGCIRLEYRSVVNENWTTLRTFVNDESLYPVDSPDKELITGPSHSYDFVYSATNPSDGEYIFRAVSVSKIGTDEITFNSDEIHVVKDVKAPAALGYPAPVNGILNAGDEISVTFNEEIQSGKLVGGTAGSNFSITGILNGDIREEPTSGIAFSGLQSAYTELPIYTNGSFSIETWFKRTNNTAGTLFAYGSGDDYISLGFDETGHVTVAIGNESHTSTMAIDNTDDTWKYIGMAYDRESGEVSVNAYQGSTNLRLLQKIEFTKNTPATQGKLYLGNNAADTSGFSGAVSLLHFYNFARTDAQMSSDKSMTKSGTETGLIGLWELEEDEGTLAKDKARSRHLTLNNTSHYIYPRGKAPTFNGIDQYARITSGTYPFGIYDDFTFEFWFKGGEQDAATLLSVGVTTYIGFDAENRLVLTTGDASRILASAGLLDDKWHHFALSVKRNGMTRASIDGVATASFNSSLFGEIGGGYYHLGVKYALGATDNDYIYSEYFAGNIDELRVWNSALTNEAILYNKNHSLRGDEAGLKAYYPFEVTQQVNGSIYSVNASLTDKIDGALTAVIFGDATLGDDSAPLQLARPVKNVPYTFTASDTKIVLNLTEEEYRLDGVTLYVTVKDVLDMHDNRSNTINWVAYVNRNALNWNIDKVDIVMEDGDKYTFKAAISNSSGEKLDYFIEDLPSWLSVDALQGTLNPLSTKELTFTVATGVNIGAYEASIVLTGTNNVKKILPVTLKVTGERPDWSVNPADFESSMTVVGQLLIKDFPQEDPEDLLAAFIGNTCIGVVSPKFEKTLRTYLVYLQIYGNNSDNGQNITFKIWDASTGSIYPLIETTLAGNAIQLQYLSNSLKGTPDVPIKFNALDAVEQSLLLNAGWNWISFNIVSASLIDANNLMTNIDNGVEIKNQDVFSRYDETSGLWINNGMNGAGFTNTEMYKVKMLGANTISLPGSPVDVENTPVALVDGWNWIAYTPQVNETLTEAFAGANPQGGDVVKSQTDFSVYVANVGWVGTLEYLRPGEGYMYNTALARSFKYPKTGIMSRSIEGDPLEGEPIMLNRPHPSLNSEVAPDYESNLSLIGEVILKSDILSENSRLIAYVGSEVRGIAEMKLVDDKRLFFLPVYSNSNSTETVTFALENNGKEIPLREYIAYKTNALVGTVSAPVILTDDNINLKVYPNPFIDRMTASFEIAQSGANVRVELISMDGKVFYSTTYTIAVAGPQLVDIDGGIIGSLTPGKYIIRVTLNDNETFTNVIIKGVY
ncbi:MAG: T9SS type A sorting domain-containing protein [Prevotellaceae bacterium]|jgi:hypothetical protein|nr:T9SS type A sorting domain-containing protein [Prevotellaceae bacterium]